MRLPFLTVVLTSVVLVAAPAHADGGEIAYVPGDQRSIRMVQSDGSGDRQLLPVQRNNINTAFAVTDVTLDAPGHAIVRTHETWYAEILDAASGRLVQRTSPATYNETYTVEFLNGGWIVTKNDL